MTQRYVDTERTTSPEDALASAHAYVRDAALRVVFDESVDPAGESHVIRCALHRSDSDDAAPLSRSTGKGVTATQSRASAFFEAIEHAAADRCLPGQAPDWDVRELGPLPSPHPDRAYEFARRARQGRPVQTLRFVPTKQSPTQDDLHYPRVACDFTYEMSDADHDLFYLRRLASSNGYASGVNVEDATLHAVHEIVERDAASEYLLSPLDPDWSATRIEDPLPTHLAGLKDSIEALTGTRAHVVLLPSVAGAVVMAYTTVNGVLAQGYGCGVDETVATERALTELHQEWVAEVEGITWQDEGGQPSGQLDRYPNMAALTVLQPPRTNISRPLSTATGNRTGVIDELAANGYSTFVRTVFEWASHDGTATVAVVHVRVPGLEDFTTLLMNFPVLPTGRLWQADLARHLTRKATPTP